MIIKEHTVIYIYITVYMKNLILESYVRILKEDRLFSPDDALVFLSLLDSNSFGSG